MANSQVSSARVGDDGWVVLPRGELDFHAASELERELDRAIAAGSRRVFVDFGGATFIDSIVLGVVLRALGRVRARGGSLALVTDDRRILRVLELTGVTRQLRVEPSLSAAVGVGAEGDPR
jgi:anti-sigma B factor antagonist